MLVESVSVKNFKLLGDFSVGGLRPFTLVGGDNGRGKTTLLEAMFMCYDRRIHPTTLPIFAPMRDPRVLHLDTVTNMFHKRNTADSLKVTCVGDGVSHRMEARLVSGGQPPIVAVPLKNAAPNGGGAAVTTGAEGVEVQFFKDQHLDGRAFIEIGATSTLQTHTEKPIPPAGKAAWMFRHGALADVDDYNVKHLSDAVVGGEKEAAVEAMKILIPQIRDINLAEIHGHSHVFIQTAEEKKQFPAVLLGGGACKLLSLTLAFYSKRDTLFLVDEITVGWHHSHLVDLWRMIFRVCRERNHQIIATTHSNESVTEFVMAAKAENTEDDCCYVRLDPSYKGDPPEKVNPMFYDYGVLEASRRTGMEVR